MLRVNCGYELELVKAGLTDNFVVLIFDTRLILQHVVFLEDSIRPENRYVIW